MSGAHRAPEATLPVPNPSPELTVPVRNPDTDSHIWERVHVEGFRLPNKQRESIGRRRHNNC
jgi:hypothetical protein